MKTKFKLLVALCLFAGLSCSEDKNKGDEPESEDTDSTPGPSGQPDGSDPHSPANPDAEEKPRLSAPRSDLRALSLGDYVLFGGGQEKSGAISDVLDFYSVSTKTNSVSTMPTKRSNFAIAGLDSKVFLAGGCQDTSCQAPAMTVDIFDIEAETWESIPAPNGRIGAKAAIVGRRVYISGGNGPISGTIDVLDVDSLTWTTLQPQSGAQGDFGLASAGGFLWIGAGVVGAEGIDSVERHNPETNTTTTVALQRECGGLVGAADTQHVVFHQCTVLPNYGRANEAYAINAQTGQLSRFPFPYALPYEFASVSVGSGKAFFNGGHDGSIPVGNFLVLDIVAGTWNPKEPGLKRYGNASAFNAGRLYVAGGTTDGSVLGITDAVEVFDVATDLWVE